jgi:tetratricopeptide (TPR) repeat protein
MSVDLAIDGPLDSATVREQFERCVREWDYKTYAALLTRYLSQPLSDSETAWAYLNLANAFAVDSRAAEAVRAHETFEQWLPGKSPRLSASFPYYPAPEGSPDAAMDSDEIRLHFLGQSVEFATAYSALGRYRDYMAKVDAALKQLTATGENAVGRYYSVRIFMEAAILAGDFERAERCLRAMYAIANESGDRECAAELNATTLLSEIQVAGQRNDHGRRAEKVRDALSLLEEVDHRGPSGWVRGYRHELAHHLIKGGAHDLALPLLDAILSTGDHFGGGYGWVMHAAAVWQVTRDRPRALTLLRQAREHDGRDLVEEFRGSTGFSDVKDDPEFLQAISRTTAR